MTEVPGIKTPNAGQRIEKELFETLVASYGKKFPSETQAFVVAKRTIWSILQSSNEVAGIRFMYGMDAERGCQSSKLFLIPCSINEERSIPVPLLLAEGYSDHQGERRLLAHVCAASATFVKNCSKDSPHFDYRRAIRGTFFGNEALQVLLEGGDNLHVSYHMGLRQEKLRPIIASESGSGNSPGLYMSGGIDCPPFCDGPGEDCLVTQATQLFSTESELNAYRAFRDQELLQFEDGAAYHEMYYFVSPRIVADLRKRDDGIEVLRHVYTRVMAPFGQLVAARRHEEALELLKASLGEVVKAYQSGRMLAGARTFS